MSQNFARYDGFGDNVGLQTERWDITSFDSASDIVEIPEPDASFDVILYIAMFQHLPNPVLSIQEFSRLLKSVKQLFTTAPFCSLTHFAPFHFFTGFNCYLMRATFRQMI